MNGLELTPPLAWLANYLLHSTLLLALAWLAEASAVLRTARSREFVWRLALLGALATATAHTLAPGVSLAGRAALPVPARAMPTGVPEMQPETYTDTGSGTAAAHVQLRPAPAARAAMNVAAAPAAEPERLPLETWLPAVWLVAALLLVLRVIVGGVFATRALGARRRLHNGSLHARLDDLCARAGTRRPALSVSRRLPGPVTLWNDEICVPAWATERLSAREQDAMLAHELAHVQRRDPLWLLAAALLEAILFLQPLNRVARKRLAALAELNADAFAARLTGNPRALAEALAQCAEHLHESSMPHALPGAAMATHRSPLVQRVERLLGGISMQDQTISRAAHFLGAMLIAVAVFALPAFGSVAFGEERGSIHVSISDDNGEAHTKLKISRSGYRLEMEAEGEVTFNDEETDIATLSQDGSFTLFEDVNGVEHELELDNRGGKLVREYSRDGDEMPMDGAAHAWLTQAIKSVLRQSGIDAEGRVARLHAKGGSEAVLDEIRLIQSDHVRGRYATILAQSFTLDEDEVIALLETLKEIDSDFELRNSLAAVAKRQALDALAQLRLLQVAKSIGSDFETGELVRLVTPGLQPTTANLKAWRELVEDLDSDFELRRSLEPVFERPLARDWQLAALEIAAAELGSDFELRSLLEQVAPVIGGDDALVERYVAAVGKIGSDFEASSAIVTLARQPGLDDADFARLTDALDDVSSDHEALQGLRAITEYRKRAQQPAAAQ